MSAAFVLDCSVVMTWLFRDEVTAATSGILDRLGAETALVPPFWFLEVANVLLVAERKKRISADQAEDFVQQLRTFDLEIDTEPSERAFSHLLPLCRAHRLTSYDAIYLDLAQRRKLPLATLDDPLRKAAKKVGVKVLGK
jgi:predicted nucleic acid-binding protein